MIGMKSLDDLAQRLTDLLPPGMDQARVDVEKNMKAALQAGFAKLDLVTREEFDVQRAVLLRTREKLALLERVLMDLESRLDVALPRAPGSDTRN
ncbi:MAG: Membrane fusogenic activity [Alphaproteobacteria bacterium ADurb.BinA280]|jgi:BMFP domain-containing protein YqiC|nr:accessory factor UbiK family protein [Xanthomonadales bacterium]MCC6505787.1 accessory factor UbiK family protein [Aquimonas sp.]OPZ12001.1 MAG: Membrane fusogenic activity [Alphaproteobacteria bacterium ADurb.BinA280]